MNVFSLSLASAAVVVMAGCASVGQDFSTADVDAMKPGITTYQEAVAKLGKPMRTTTQADGQMAVGWSRASAVMGAVSSKGVVILFDKEGKMIRVVHRTELQTN